MKNEIKKDLSDEDIDKLFNENNTDVLKNDTDTLDIPPELSIEKDDNTDYVERTKTPDSSKTLIKKEIKEINTKIDNDIENNIFNVKSLTSLDQARKYIKKINQLRDKEKLKEYTTKQILSGLTKINVDSSTECTFHIYKPREILGNQIHCCCKYCSAYKLFTQNEWDDYCIQYRKWF